MTPKDIGIFSKKKFFPLLVFDYISRFCHHQLCCNLRGYQNHSRHHWLGSIVRLRKYDGIYWSSHVSKRYIFMVCIILWKYFYRTMLVHSERIIYVYGFCGLCSSLVLDTLRIYYGPFSKFICWWYKFSKNFASTGLQFGFSFTILIRVRKNSYPSTGKWPNLEQNQLNSDLLFLFSVPINCEKTKHIRLQWSVFQSVYQFDCLFHILYYCFNK